MSLDFVGRRAMMNRTIPDQHTNKVPCYPVFSTADVDLLNLLKEVKDLKNQHQGGGRNSDKHRLFRAILPSYPGKYLPILPSYPVHSAELPGLMFVNLPSYPVG